MYCVGGQKNLNRNATLQVAVTTDPNDSDGSSFSSVLSLQATTHHQSIKGNGPQKANRTVMVFARQFLNALLTQHDPETLHVHKLPNQHPPKLCLILLLIWLMHFLFFFKHLLILR